MKYILSFVLVAFPFLLFAQTANITTVAGNGVLGYSGNGGPATAASFHFISDVVLHGGILYIADMDNNQVRKVEDGIVRIVAGASISGGYTGDGGPATAANINAPAGLTIDLAGNLYIACSGSVRKVNTSGIITTVAGNGTWGYSGDGGPATAAMLSSTWSVVTDVTGNLYIADEGNRLVRKVNTSGIITTIAGNSSSSYSGDGGAATAAAIGSPYGLAIDGTGNLYISDNMNGYIRKITTDGIIHTFAGGGTSGYVEGVSATACQLFMPSKVRVDGIGNVYVANGGFFRVNKINSSGIITTVAGNGTGGYSGDGGPATAAELSWPSGVCLDDFGTLYIGEQVNNRVRMVSAGVSIVGDSFSVFVGYDCSSVQFIISTRAQSAGQHVKTTFGNGTSLDTITTSGIAGGGANFYTQYGESGTYTIKHVLYDGLVAVDSISYPYEFQFCTTMGVKYYNDLNANCIKDMTEPYSCFPILTEIDSNGISVDTISTTGGFYYNANGHPGDIYSFKLIGTPGDIYPSCPSTGIISDTVQYFPCTLPVKVMGLACSSTTDFDLGGYMSTKTGRHMQIVDMLVNNTYCTPINATVIFNFSPKYVFGSAVPTPSSTTATSATWDFSGVSAYSGQQLIGVTLNVPGTWLLPGDTVNSEISVTPTSGDVDISNNTCTDNDTVKTSFDPNEMSVSPQGFISAGTQLQYTITFENTGNDTAQNIYVMDTLSDDVDVRTLRLVAASAPMNISLYKISGHNIAKFDFPSIKLLDSSHHNQCDGVLIFNIKSLTGLVAGTTIYNHAGIFFDDNPVVMTDTVVNVINGTLNVNAKIKINSSTIYPNPAGNNITIQTGNGKYSSFIITNNYGQIVLQNSVTNSSTYVDVKSLPQGLYFIKLLGEQDTEVLKFIKE